LDTQGTRKNAQKKECRVNSEKQENPLRSFESCLLIVCRKKGRFFGHNSRQLSKVDYNVAIWPKLRVNVG
jgi:hypothetical protein